jgi:hypothetical protein
MSFYNVSKVIVTASKNGGLEPADDWVEPLCNGSCAWEELQDWHDSVLNISCVEGSVLAL